MNKRECFYQRLSDLIGDTIFLSEIVDLAEEIYCLYSEKIQVQEEDPTLEGVLPDIDAVPLNGDGKRLFEYLVNHPGYHTPYELSEATGIVTGSVQSHMRNYRTAKYGSQTVNKRRRGRVYEYQLIPNTESFTYRHLYE